MNNHNDYKNRQTEEIDINIFAHHLPCSHADCFDREFSTAHIEKVLKTGTK